MSVILNTLAMRSGLAEAAIWMKLFSIINRKGSRRGLVSSVSAY